jgi:5-methylcytosine-specific restriction endonuclease McrA
LRRERFENRPCAQRADLTGNRYGNLTVLSYAESRKNVRGHTDALWRCRCDCGKEVSVMASGLVRGHSRSCGCARAETIRKRYGLPEEQRIRNYLVKTCKRGAESRGIPFELTDDEVWALSDAPCAYCGAEPALRSFSNPASYKYSTGVTKTEFRANGIDRIDTSGPYRADNCRTACWVCNRAKAYRTEADFLDWLENFGTPREPVEPTFNRTGLTDHFHAYRQGAKVRGLAFDLTREAFEALVLRPCGYCSMPPELLVRRRKGKPEVTFHAHGLDRIDNASGYVDGNVLPCCSFCNRAKGPDPADAFRTWADRVRTRCVEAVAA